MDTELVETLLIELLQQGRESFTREKVLTSLTLAATAAGGTLSYKGTPLQHEQDRKSVV